MKQNTEEIAIATKKKATEIKLITVEKTQSI